MLPEHVSQLGYSTVGLGKWNIGHCTEEYLPWNRGFDYFLGYMTAAVSATARAGSSSTFAGGENYQLFDQLEGRSARGRATASSAPQSTAPPRCAAAAWA